MQKEYISWSELYLYKKDKNDYYLQYILGVKPEPTDEMTLGSIVHDCISGKISDLDKAIEAHHFTSDYKRICRELIDTAPRYPIGEQALYLKGNKENGFLCDLMTIYDGLDLEKNIIGEYKTTKNGWRSQKDVDEHGQITLYAISYYFIFGKFPNILLHRLDMNNGKIKTFSTSRGQDDFEFMREEINSMYQDLCSLGWWKRRQIKSDRFIVEAIRNTRNYEQTRYNLLRTSEES